MKKILPLAFFIFSISASAQISTTRMNEMRLNNTLAEVEKALGKKLEIAKKVDDYFYTIKINDKGSDFNLSFIENSDENGRTYYSLYEISTKSTQIKTLSKVGIGSSLDDLWKAYKNYNINLWNNWDEKTEKYSTKERTFQLSDFDAGTVIYFELENDKVVGVTISVHEGC
jgi:hypothetical protein